MLKLDKTTYVVVKNGERVHFVSCPIFDQECLGHGKHVISQFQEFFLHNIDDTKPYGALILVGKNLHVLKYFLRVD